MDQIFKILSFCRLIDDDGRLSLTNLATICAIINLLFCQQVGFEQVGAFVASLVSYQFKRYVSGQPASGAEELAALKEQVGKLQTSVTSVQLSSGMKPRL
jgi:hypothetical protein